MENRGKNKSQEIGDSPAMTHSRDETVAHASNLVFVVNHDTEAAEELALQIRYYGYEVEIFSQLAKCKTALQQRPDAVILMEVGVAEDEIGGIRAMQALQQSLQQPARVIFISIRDNLEYRLEAVRAGGLAYFVQPFNPVELICQLDLITASQVQDPFRILIVYGDRTVALDHAGLLEQTGMTVKTAADPMNLTAALKEFNPDLILMDFHLPQCSGLELAKVIRQFDGFINLPVVYLATEDDFSKQVETLSLQRDDLLVQPVSTPTLIATINTCVMRARALHALMMHDGLTGVLNHSAIKEELVREVIRANRLNTSLSYALIDIDFFNKINGKYGFSAGDHVLKSLARLLKQRLRGTDVIGRYGGEEFAIIMNDTDAASAAKVIEEIRAVFSRLPHAGYEEEFNVSFSCGIADIASFQDAASLAEAAEKALFQAKQRGRNKVVVNSANE
ncbi:MAG: diguanylate cyclase [Nitrosomonas sp.]|nr:MAG: diguanylate cyclase [Nitrosomonas sp.]